MKTKTFLLTMLFFLAACSHVTVTPQATVTLPTVTPLPPTVTSIPTLTATPVVEKLDNTCWEVKPLVEAKQEISGSLVYYDGNLKRNMLLDISSLKAKRSPGSFIYLSDISPDGSMFVDTDYYGYYHNKITITSATQSRSFSEPKNAYFGGFLSNDQIWFGSSRAELEHYVEGKGSVGEYYTLSLLTGNITSYSVQLPHFWTNKPAITRIESYLVYSPNLNYAVYSSETNNTLLNLKTSEVVWNGDSPYDLMSAPEPVWKPDSSAVIIDSYDDNHNYNFHNIDIAGRDTQLTHLDRIFGKLYFPSTPFWSHDSRYFAFMTSSDALSRLSLFIFDSHTNTLFNPCISENTNENLDRWIPLFWSPVGDQLALTFGGKAKLVKQDVVQEVPPDTLIIDLATRKIYKLPITDYIRGWLSWEIP